MPRGSLGTRAAGVEIKSVPDTSRKVLICRRNKGGVLIDVKTEMKLCGITRSRDAARFIYLIRCDREERALLHN